MSVEKFLGYPLAILGSIALIAPASDGGGLLRGTEGTVSAFRAGSDEKSWQDSDFGSGATGPRQARHWPGRSSAESAELRALRVAEGSLFPELGSPELDQRDAAPRSAACESPDYELAKSTRIDVSPAGEWLRGLQRPDIAVPRDPKVARYIRYFGADPKGRETFSQWLKRSGSYRQIVEAALAKRNLPKDLVAVMFVESGCLPKATSLAGAAGLWQFMPQTARAYGLVVEGDIDERRNIWRSTEAAVAHLSDLYAQFESWHLAMAAYNFGYQQLMDRLKDNGVEDFFALSKLPEALPRETLLYVPKILAVAVILKNLEYFGFDGVEKRPSISASRMDVPARTRLSLIARAAGTSLRKLEALNPQVLGEVVPDTGEPAYVYLPNSGLARARTMLPRLLEQAQSRPIDLKVTADFDWGREEFDANWRSRLERTKPDVTNQERERAHSTPQQEHQPNDAVSLLQHERQSTWGYPDPSTLAMSRQEAVTYYRIKRGDTLAKVARRFKLTTSELAKANGISDVRRIRAGAKLKIVLSEGG